MFNFDFTIPIDDASITRVLLTLFNAVEISILTVAEHHGNAPGAWLDDLQNAIEQRVKNAGSDGLSYAEEADTGELGIKVIRGIFADIRRALDQK